DIAVIGSCTYTHSYTVAIHSSLNAIHDNEQLQPVIRILQCRQPRTSSSPRATPCASAASAAHAGRTRESARIILPLITPEYSLHSKHCCILKSSHYSVHE